MESLFATLKTECFRKRIPKYRFQAQAMLFGYVETSIVQRKAPSFGARLRLTCSSSPPNQYSRFVEIFCICFRIVMSPREAEEVRIQIAEAVQRRDDLYRKLKVSIEDLSEVERLERELLKAQQDVVATFDKRGAATASCE